MRAARLFLRSMPLRDHGHRCSHAYSRRAIRAEIAHSRWRPAPVAASSDSASATNGGSAGIPSSGLAQGSSAERRPLSRLHLNLNEVLYVLRPGLLHGDTLLLPARAGTGELPKHSSLSPWACSDIAPGASESAQATARDLASGGHSPRIKRRKPNTARRVTCDGIAADRTIRIPLFANSRANRKYVPTSAVLTVATLMPR